MPGMARPGRAVPSCAGRIDHVVEVGQDVIAVGGIAEPPPRAVRDEQLLAQQRLGELRQVGAQAAVLGERGAQRIGDEIGMRRTACSRPTGPAKPEEFELQRVGDGAGDAAHDQVDRHQAVQRLQRHAVVGDAQVAAFHQQQAEVAGEVGVAEEVVVARARRQQGDGRDRRGWRGARARACSCWKKGASRSALQAAKMSPATLVCTMRLASA